MTTQSGNQSANYRRGTFLHGLALLTFVATWPLLLLGAEVTTKKVGMVDRVGFRAPWHLFTVSWQEQGLGFLIEHSHRLAGFLVGTCAIALAVGLWLREPRRWVRWLGLAGLVGVSAQGVLGILRVNLNIQAGPELAMIHGCFAPLVVSLLASLALFTSRAWDRLGAPSLAPPDGVRIWRGSLVTTGLVYLQIVLGAMVRHQDQPLGARAHLLVAFAVVAAVVWLLKTVLDSPVRERLFRGTVLLLPALVLVQLFLGVEAWLSKFASVQWRQVQPLKVHPELLRSVHSLTGTLILATAVVATLQAYRLMSMVTGGDVSDERTAAGEILAPNQRAETTHHSPVGGAA